MFDQVLYRKSLTKSTVFPIENDGSVFLNEDKSSEVSQIARALA